MIKEWTKNKSNYEAGVFTLVINHIVKLSIEGCNSIQPLPMLLFPYQILELNLLALWLLMTRVGDHPDNAHYIHISKTPNLNLAIINFFSTVNGKCSAEEKFRVFRVWQIQSRNFYAGYWCYSSIIIIFIIGKWVLIPRSNFDPSHNWLHMTYKYEWVSFAGSVNYVGVCIN